MYQFHHLNGFEISDDLNALLVIADMINIQMEWKQDMIII